jgi:branched-chain amino acid transport system substrate-binding protein
MRVSKRARWALVFVAAAALVLAATAAARTHSTAAKKPIVIGWAFDNKGPMQPFDTPALAAAQLRVAQVNKKGVDGRKIVIKTCKTQGDDPTASKTCADKLIGEGANVIFTTCDVDLAAPVVQESLKHHLLTVAPCIGTDQMGPKRFGKPGKLAFSFGNVAQDEGSAMAQVAWSHGWKTADLATDTTIVYFKAVVTAFKARFQQLGGKIEYETSYQDPALQPGSTNFNNAASGVEAHPAKVIVTVTSGSYGAQVPFITDLRTAGVNTPILNSWAGDGTYWLPQNPKVTNYWFVTYANAFGHDPSAAVNKLAKKIKAATGGFVTGPAAIDGLVTAIKRAHGSLVGSKLAAVMQKFHKVPTISGNVSFSAKLHSVFGREYRVVEINNNVPIAKGTVTAKVVPNTPDS